MARIRSVFNVEEFDESVVEGAETTETTIADNIVASNDNVEINNEISSFEEQCEVFADANEVAGELQEQVEQQEEVIEEAPESVTEDTVAVAQEQFYVTISKLGDLRNYSEDGRISRELSSGTPLERLKLSTEGVKEFIGKIIDKIIAFFKKIGSFFKNLWNKIFNSVEVKKEKANMTIKEISNIAVNIQAGMKVDEAIKNEIDESSKNRFGFIDDEKTLEKLLTKGSSILDDVINLMQDRTLEYLEVSNSLLADLKSNGEKRIDNIDSLDKILSNRTSELLTKLTDKSNINDSFFKMISPEQKHELLLKMKNVMNSIIFVKSMGLTKGTISIIAFEKNNDNSTINMRVIDNITFTFTSKMTWQNKMKFIENISKNVKKIQSSLNIIYNNKYQEIKKFINKYNNDIAKLNKDLEDYKKYMEQNADNRTNYMSQNVLKLINSIIIESSKANQGIAISLNWYYNDYNNILTWIKDSITKIKKYN